MTNIIFSDTFNGVSDEDILNRTPEEPWLFVALIEKYQGLFLNEIYAIVSNEEEAFEIVYETFGKIYVEVNMLKHSQHASFSSWAYILLFRTAESYSRRKRKTNVLLTDTLTARQNQLNTTLSSNANCSGQLPSLK